MAKASLLVSGCERAPKAENLTFVPPGGFAYKVQSGDDWWKLAARPEVKATGYDALGLCAYNFGTRVPAEINWYLRNKVGCVKATSDHKNYMFSTDADPGIVYLPPPQAVPTPVVTPPNTKIRINSWLGIGGKFGSTVIIMGIEQVGGMLVSIQDLVNTEPQIRTIVFNAQTTRMGLGVGASGGACIIYATSLPGAGDLSRLLAGGVDFNLALGGNVGSVIKGAKVAGKLAKLEPLIEFFLKIGAKSPEVLKAALKQPDKLGDLYKAVMGLRDSIGSEVDAPEPSVLMVDVPAASAGTEVALFHAVTEFRVLGQPTVDINWTQSPP